jgi:hypothetical protein
MQNKTIEYLKDMYLAPFRAIAGLMKLFVRNRNRVRDFVRQPGIAKTLKYGMLLTLFIWLAIALLTKDEETNRLTEALDNLWSKTVNDTAENGPATENKPPK